MRLHCSVSVSNQLLPSLNVRGKQRAKNSCLTLHVRRSSSANSTEDKKSRVILILSTAQNTTGTKYTILGNIKQVFTKFVSEGKATIRFSEPPHDLAINAADPLQLKSFLNALNMALKNKDLNQIHFSQPPTKVQKPKTRLIVTKRDDYPFSSGFPFTLTVLHLNNCALRKLSTGILRLPFLENLDLSCNDFESLTPEFANFGNLKELSLAHNKFTDLPLPICSQKLMKSLLTLNLDNNKITSLPSEICNLKFLNMLSINCNGLQELPKSIGKLKYLRVLNAAHNEIKVLPCSVMQLKLDSLDLHTNPLNATLSSHLPRRFDCAPTLKECAAQTIVAWKVRYTDEDLPPQLIDYLQTCHWCLCGRPLFSADTKPSVGLVDLLRIAKSVTLVDSFGQRNVPVEITSLPSEICNLKFLNMLSINCNGLQELPKSIGKLKYLRVLNAAHNEIKVLPCSVMQLKLDSLDLHTNPLNATLSSHLPRRFDCAPTLKECAAQTIVAWKVRYTDEDLPPQLIDYLQTCHWCLCGRPLFSADTKPSVGLVDLLRIAKSVTLVDSFGQRNVPVEVSICKFCLVPNTLQF